jgi:5,10-methylenetetrahydromethanopterin reductase
MTTPPVRVGICFVPTMPPEQLRPLALAAEAAGRDELWVWEDCFKESGLASAAVALASTERITVGLGLMPAPLRNVALTAMEIATLDRIFPGRLLPGIGHGVQPWMAQTGSKVESPLTLLREYAVALRRLLDGEKVTVSGRYVTLDDVALDHPPSGRVPLQIGGAGPKTLALAGELGDGTLLTGQLTPEEFRSSCATTLDAVPAGKRSAERPHDIVGSFITATGDGAADRARRELRVWGKEPDLTLAATGTAEQVAARYRGLAGYGVTAVAAQPTADEPDVDGLVRFLGEQVRPLL